MKRNPKMQTVLETIEDVPDYALSYLVNGDASGLEGEDQADIDGWFDYFQAIADKRGGHVIISPSDEEPSFTHNPAFGLACDTVPTTVIILAPPLPAKGTLERRIYDLLEDCHGVSKFDVVAYGLLHDGEGWSVNDPWYLGHACTVPEVLEHARGRFEVFKANYAPRARVNAIEDTNYCGDGPITLDCEGIPFLEIRPCTED